MWCVVFFVLVPSMCAQEAAAPQHTGVPQDWSQHHIVFSRDALARHPELVYREPRIRHQAMQRWQAPNSDVFRGADPLPPDADKSGHHRDWSVAMGGRISAHMFPAKFSFDPGAPPDCANDYVVFGLAAAETPGASGAGIHPNLVAFNNLYVDPAGDGFCVNPITKVGLKAPTVLFAYNITTVTGGKIATSPILSLDGKKIGFVESIPANVGAGITAHAIFHVLTWAPLQGTLKAAAPPTMVSVPFSPAANSTTSSPWIDYGSDIVYLGADNGQVYKITGVFKGTPTLAKSPWPVTLGKLHLTPPVLDSGLGLLMVGSANGNLYQIDLNSPALAFATLPVGAAGLNHGILAAPIVDVTNGTTFVVSSNDGTSAVLEEVDTASMTLISKARIGWGSLSGTTVDLYEPAFTHDYFNDPSKGFVSLCGTGLNDTIPNQYEFGFTGRDMNVTPAAGFPVPLSPSTATTDRCTGWTEFFNPFAGSADTITATSVTSNVLTVTASNSNLTLGEEVYIQGTEEGFLNGQPVIVASLIGLAPTYTGFTASFTASNYTNASDKGTVSAGTDFFFFGLTEDCTLLPGGAGVITGCVVALSSDPTIPTVSAAVTGGPSGIVVDNYSTAGQASSIYLTGENVQTAYKFTQNGLQ
jgi:hypothetical protein